MLSWTHFLHELWIWFISMCFIRGWSQPHWGRKLLVQEKVWTSSDIRGWLSVEIGHLRHFWSHPLFSVFSFSGGQVGQKDKGCHFCAQSRAAVQTGARAALIMPHPGCCNQTCGEMRPQIAKQKWGVWRLTGNTAEGEEKSLNIFSLPKTYTSKKSVPHQCLPSK